MNSRCEAFSEPSRSGLRRTALAFLWILIFTIPWDAMLMVPGVGTVGRLAGFPALASGILAIAESDRMRRSHPALLIAGWFMSWAGLTWFWTAAPEITILRLYTYVQLFLMSWLIWQLCGEQRDVVRLIQAYVLGTLVSASGTIFQYLGAIEVHYQRYAAVGFDPNELGLMLALSIPMSCYLAIRASAGMSVLYAVHVPIVATAMILGSSRSAWIAMLLAVSFVPVVVREASGPKKILVMLAFVTAVSSAAIYVPKSSWDRISTVRTEMFGGNLNGRTVAWAIGWDAFRQVPFQGIGSGAFESVAERRVGVTESGRALIAHNTFLSVLVENGVIGFTLFVSMVAALALSISRMHGLSRALWVFCVAIWVIGACSLTWEFQKTTWFVFAMVMTHSNARHA